MMAVLAMMTMLVTMVMTTMMMTAMMARIVMTRIMKPTTIMMAGGPEPTVEDSVEPNPRQKT